MSALAPVFGSEGCTEKILPIVESMVADPMFYVRKEAAAAVGSLSTAVSPEITLERLVNIMYIFNDGPNDSNIYSFIVVAPLFETIC